MLNKYCFHLFSFIFYLFGVGDCICWQLTGILNENVYTHTYALTCRLAWSWLHISSLFGITTRYLTAATWNNRQTSETVQCIVHIHIEVKWVNEQPNKPTNEHIAVALAAAAAHINIHNNNSVNGLDWFLFIVSFSTRKRTMTISFWNSDNCGDKHTYTDTLNTLFCYTKIKYDGISSRTLRE